jgi:hypothetical protein
MDALVGDVVFAVGDTRYFVDDVGRAAEFWGDQGHLEGQLREGLACLKYAATNGGVPTERDVSDAASEFRYERDLITAQETESWLERWSLTVESWTEYLRRSLLRQRRASELAEIVSRYPVTAEEVTGSLHAEAICSGYFGRLAHKLAGRVAAYQRAREEGWLQDEAEGLEGLEVGFQRLCARALTLAALRAEVASHHVDWIRVECEYVCFPHLQSAREAALCVREDGRPLDAVARDARAAVTRARLHLDELDADWKDHVLSASPGEILGPLRWDASFALMLVREKILPSLEDAEVRRRAEASVVERAVEHEINLRVRWHSRP